MLIPWPSLMLMLRELTLATDSLMPKGLYSEPAYRRSDEPPVYLESIAIKGLKTQAYEGSHLYFTQRVSDDTVRE